MSRRKNATRESTATLKAWLAEHKKNPYPTKGEKIMLAIITKMTLTQVSTWFANARRRLKKENKITWHPKNSTEDDDDNDYDEPYEQSNVDDADGKRQNKSKTDTADSDDWNNNAVEKRHGAGASTSENTACNAAQTVQTAGASVGVEKNVGGNELAAVAAKAKGTLFYAI